MGEMNVQMNETAYILSTPQTLGKRKRIDLNEEDDNDNEDDALVQNMQIFKRPKLTSSFNKISRSKNKDKSNTKETKENDSKQINLIFAWMVHRFDVFDAIKNEHPSQPMPPRLSGSTSL